jgi:hypothetical protein
MKDSLEKLINASVLMAILIGSWVLVALASGIFVGIARKAYNWVV